MENFLYRNKILIDSPFPWWEWDVLNNTVDFNDKKALMLGYEPEMFSSGGYQAFTDLLHPDDYEKTMKAMKQLLDGEKGLYQIDYRIRAADSSYHWYMDRGAVSERNNDKTIKKIRGIVIDLGDKASGDAGKDILIKLINNSVQASNGFSVSFITICSGCQKTKVESGLWVSVPEKIKNVIGEKISHGLCPECIKKLYPDMAETILRELHL